MDNETALLDVQQVAELLNCSVRHVYRLVDSGKMPRPVRLGTLCRWSREELDDWIAAGCKPIRMATARQMHRNRTGALSPAQLENRRNPPAQH